MTNHLPRSEINRHFRLTLDAEQGRNTALRYNIAPTQNVFFFHNETDGA